MIIEVESLQLQFEGKRRERIGVLEDVSFRVAQGQSLAIIGPSGCGKTSLLYILCGLLRPTAGTVRVHGWPVEGPRKDVALILQNIGLLPWKTVWNNVVLGLHPNGACDRQRIRSILAELGLEGLYSRYPGQLSGGQMKRVGLARALAREPLLLLMDEPLASLDALTKEKLQDQVLTLWGERELSTVLVTHDIEEAAFLGERIIVLSDRPASIKALIENSEMGDIKYRKTDQFYAKVRELRNLL